MKIQGNIEMITQTVHSVDVAELIHDSNLPYCVYSRGTGAAVI